MEHFEEPLIIEKHSGYEDVYVWKGLPGGFSKFDLYFVIGLNLVVIISMIIQGVTGLTNYLLSILVLIIVSGLYKGFKVGLDSIGYKPYEDPYLTRLADDFLIWANDPGISIKDSMTVVVRPTNADQKGAVYLYEGKERHITFIADDDIYLEQFADILQQKYGLARTENVSE